MLLYLLGIVGYPLLHDRPEWLLILVTLAGLGLLAAGRRNAPSWLKPVTAGIVVEELFLTSALFGVYPEGDGVLVRAGMAGCGGLLALALAVGAPLPDRWLPMQGQWLRRFLAAGALVLLVAGSSWYGLWQQWWALNLPRWPLVPGLLVAALLLAHAWRGLSAGLVKLHRTGPVRWRIAIG